MATKKVQNENLNLDDVSVLKEKVSELSKRNVVLEEQVSGDVSEIETRDTRIEELEEEINSLNGTISGLHSQVESLNEAFSAVAIERDKALEEVDRLNVKVESCDGTIQQLKDVISTLQKDNEQIGDLAHRVSVYRSALIQLSKEIG